MKVNKLSYTLFLIAFVNPLSYTNTKKLSKNLIILLQQYYR